MRHTKVKGDHFDTPECYTVGLRARANNPLEVQGLELAGMYQYPCSGLGTASEVKASTSVVVLWQHQKSEPVPLQWAWGSIRSQGQYLCSGLVAASEVKASTPVVILWQHQKSEPVPL